LAISKEKKQQMLADYVERMSKSEAMILTDYRGLTVADLTDLRRRLREVDGAFQIVKNTLFLRALDEIGASLPGDDLDGPLALGYCMGEVPPVAKILVDYAGENEKLEIKGALMGSSFLDAKGVKGLGDLPPREVLLSQLVGSIQGPMSSLVSTLNAPMRELVQVLQARAEQEGEAAA
jgi:large subunit ribosomal protein L10